LIKKRHQATRGFQASTAPIVRKEEEHYGSEMAAGYTFPSETQMMVKFLGLTSSVSHEGYMLAFFSSMCYK
jgi:hypothetical protein